MPTATAIDPSVRLRGVVKWFRPSDDTKSNYGFITKQDGEDVFVHGKNVSASDYPLQEGDDVEFCVKRGRDGRPTAGDVVKVR